MAVELDSKTDEAYFDGGMLHYIGRNYQQAITSWNKAIELNPSNKAELDPWIQSAKSKLKK